MKLEHYETLYETERAHWWYRVRRQIVWYLLKKYLPQGGSVLDIGCGTGELLVELGNSYTVSGVDSSPTAIEYCRRRGISSVRLSESASTGYADAAFDAVLCLDVLEHIENEHPTLSEVHRVLKPGGLFIASSPAFPSLWGVTDELSHHYRRYRLGPFSRIIEDAGFEIVRATYFNTFLFFPIAFFRFVSRLLRRSVVSENRVGGAFVNTVLYLIFGSELAFLKHMNFPFGVSVMVIARKR